MPDVTKTRFLEFLGETEPATLASIVDEVAQLDTKSLEPGPSRPIGDDLEALEGLLADLAEVDFTDSLQIGRPRFSISPQELRWLSYHDKSVWLEYLIHRYKFKVFPAMKKEADFPPYLLIEPTSICNLRCVMCFQVDESFTRDKSFMGHMDWDLFTSLVDQAKEHRCHSVTLASRGEPMLHKQIGKMLRYLGDADILDVKINTTTRLSESLIHDVLGSGVTTMTFSVDASDKETYERIRVLGKFDEVLNNIELFNTIRNKEYPDAVTTTRVGGVAVEGSQDPDEMERFWSQYVDLVSFNKLVPRWDSYNNEKAGLKSVCGFLYERMYVWWDGTSNPCDFDYKSPLAVGDAREQSISETWQGEKYQRLRSLHEKMQRSALNPCDRCPL